MKKVAFCVPSTTNKREWSQINETDLWSVLLTQLEDKTPTDCEICLYIGYDDDDKVFSQLEQRMKANAIFKNFQIKWIEFTDLEKGHVTTIWNGLAKKAIDDGYEYLKILGDDISLPNDKGWLSCFINKLKKNQNIGYVSGWSNNNSIPTQFLLHKTHYDIFGFIYPEEIKNWGCDNWLHEVYPNRYGLWLKNYQLLNVGGEPRYDIVWNEKFVKAIVKRYKTKFNRFISSKNK
jgi:hypothetical protein